MRPPRWRAQKVGYSEWLPTCKEGLVFVCAQVHQITDLEKSFKGFDGSLRCYLRCTLQGRIRRSKSQLYTQAWQPKLKHNRQWGDEVHIPCQICISPTRNKHAINKQTGPGPKANNHHSWHSALRGPLTRYAKRKSANLKQREASTSSPKIRCQKGTQN